MKRLIKNYLYNLSYQILLMILPIVTTPYVSRVLKADGVGMYNYGYAIVSVVVIIAQLGTNMYGQREIAYVQNDNEKRSDTFWNVFLIRFFTSIIVIPIYILISFQLKAYTALLLGMTIYLVANMFDVSWFFQGLEDFKKTAVRSIAVKILGVALIFTLVKSEKDVILYAVILAFSQLVGNILLLFYIPQYINRFDLGRVSVASHIKPILELFLPTAAIYIYTYVDKIILGIISTDAQVGFYSQPEKIVKLLMTILTSLGTVMLPHIAAAVQSKDLERIRKELMDSISFVFCLGLPMVVGAIVVADRFIPWFLGTYYYESIIPFMILSPLILIIGLASVVGQAILIPLKKQKIYTISIISGAILNLIFNLILIPQLAAIGAAIGTIIAEITVTTIQFVEVKRSIGISLWNCGKSCKNYIIGTVTVGVIGSIVNYLLPHDFWALILLVIICMVVYVAILLLKKDRLLFGVIKGFIL